MSGDIKKFLDEQKLQILEEKIRLGFLELHNPEENKENFTKNVGQIVKQDGGCDKSCLQQDEENFSDGRSFPSEEKLQDKKKEGKLNGNRENDKENGIFGDEDKENRLGKASFRGKSAGSVLRYTDNVYKDKQENLEFENVPSVVEPLDFRRYYELALENKKQALIDRLVNSEGPFSSRSDGAVGHTFARDGTTTFGPPILRRGEYSPTGYSSLRAAPHEGLGEYEIRRGLYQERRKRDYLRHLAKKNHDTIAEVVKEPVETKHQERPKSSRSTNTEISVSSKLVQTDIQNIKNELVVQYDKLRSHPSPEKELSPPRTVTDELVDAALRNKQRPYRIDQRLTSAQNEFLLRGAGITASVSAMDKPKSILSNRRTGSPRDRFSSDLGQSSYTPTTFMDGFSYSDRGDNLERERLKRETYQHELRLQIEEKRHLHAMRDDQERRERELENKRLEQQVLRMQEEQMVEEQRRARRDDLMRRHSDDLLRRKTELHELQRPWRRHADSESANLDSLGLGTSSSPAYGSGGGGYSGSHYSPPVSRRMPPYSSYNVPATSVFPDTSRYNPSRFESSSYSGGGILRKDTLKRMDSLNSYDTVPLRSHQRSRFDRFDSLSRIDSLSHRLETMSVRDGLSSDLTDVQRRHSATQQDLSLLRKSPRLRRRNSSSRFDDTLPIPVLKARSPVAKELKNAIPFSSQRTHHGSDVQRRLEDRWQIPAVQKNVLHPAESPGRGSILTQLGSIRAQLQREQLRMDETLRRRGLVRTRTTEDY